MTIIAIYQQTPSFPPEDQQPGALRTVIGGLTADYTGAVPVQADIDALAAPGLAEAARKASLKTNARAVVLINALTTLGDTALNGAVAARYPGLTGDALKFAQDVALVMAYTYRNGG